MSFVIDKQGDYLPVLGETTGGGGGGTSNHAQLSNLDYANSGHTGFMTSANYLPKGTTINVKTDGSGDYTTIKDALDSLKGKWSDGDVIIQLGNGTFEVAATYQIISSNFNIPKLFIQGTGTSNTTISWTTTTAGADVFRVVGQNMVFKDFTLQNPNGTTSTDYRGIMCIDNGYAFINNVNFIGINDAVWSFRGGNTTFTNCNFSNCLTAVSAGNGNVNIQWATTGTFNNVVTAFAVSGGGIIKGGGNTFTFTSVTNKASQTPGTATTSGWIAVDGLT